MADALEKFAGKGVENRLMHKSALDGNATLSGVGKTTVSTPLGSAVQVGIRMDHDRGIAAQFERDTLFAGFLLEHPAHGRAAGEGKHLDPFICHQRLGEFVGAEEGVKLTWWRAGFLHDARKIQRRQGSLRRGFQQHRIATGKSGRHFVSQPRQPDLVRADIRNDNVLIVQRPAQIRNDFLRLERKGWVVVVLLQFVPQFSPYRQTRHSLPRTANPRQFAQGSGKSTHHADTNDVGGIHFRRGGVYMDDRLVVCRIP